MVRKPSNTTRIHRVILTSLLALSGLAIPTVGQTEDAKSLYESDALPLFEKYCVRCHGDKRQRAKLDLERFPDTKSVLKSRKVFESGLHLLLNHEMPPEKSKQPTAEERETLVEAIRSALDSYDCSGEADPGRPTIRRLNAVEYRNTIRDLVGVDFQPAEDFPADEIGYGFDNIGDVLSIPPLLLEKYLDAAEAIVDSAFGGVESKAYVPVRRKVDAKLGSASTKLEFALDGHYELRARIASTGAKGALELRIDEKVVSRKDLTESNEDRQIVSWKVHVKKGERKVGLDRVSGDGEVHVDGVEMRLVQADASKAPRRSVYAVEPLDEEGQFASDHVREIFETFATRAYRREITDDELQRLRDLGRQAFQNGNNLDESIQLVLKAILVSPHFLFRVELDENPEDAKKIRRVGGYELATRLSYFLWSTMPDEELTRLAKSNELQDDKVLAAQVKRMLADERSSAFIENFAGQWLQTRFLEGVTPDPTIFPEYTPALRESMRRETLMFVEAILREDRSIVELIDSDFTFLDERLAKHYGIENVKGNTFRRVDLGDTPRGGVLTQASVLTLTSYPTRTSPVLRGKWILEKILGIPPPPPPPDVEELSEEKQAIEAASLRERLEKHREDPNCGVCHSKLDPLGFAFENYDAIGRWRDSDGRFLVDASAVLPDGSKFEGPGGFKKILIDRRREFCRALAEQVLTYALGRGLEYYDRCAVDEIVDKAAESGYKMSEMILAVVHTDPFRMRRGGDVHRE